ncbi:MAG: LuxR C-terminal-related transcriptional regulator [Ruminococcus sp.]|nr:LuxR C-terminal-related transcriptional regulator [Ruminococcus sp.]
MQSRSVATEMICAIVNRLSRREYQVCILIYSGASYAEVAKQLEISVKSVDNALQHARRKMRLETESAVV